MKSFLKLFLAGTVLALAACSTTDNGGTKMQNYEEQAPYSHERTVGGSHAADHVYSSHQNK